MHRPGVADFETVWTLARGRAEREGRPRCRTGLGLRIKPFGIDRVGAPEIGAVPGWADPDG